MRAAPFIWLLIALTAFGNPYTYLDENDPFYVGRDFPKLTTPQWIGEPDVEAVVILAIDDMRSTANYEKYLRPILERLKQIDGRAPVSIYCNALNPADPHLQTWLKEGLSLENHTLAHPCPLLAQNNFRKAADTYHGGVELLNTITNNKAIAYRMPCCDSMNSPSPRFYAEIFNRTNSKGEFLTIDSSVMNLPTSKDNAVPKSLTTESDGSERFYKYLPTQTNSKVKVSMGSFVTTIEDYPYPYVIGKLCWEFPAMAPSDWEAQNLHGVNNPKTIEDWKAALDIAVIKQGLFSFIFHPHGWIKPEQLVEFINYVQSKYGKKVKFLTFREAAERMEKHLLAGQPIRNPTTGGENGVRILDLNKDGYLDVVIGNPNKQVTRLWDPNARKWIETSFPAAPQSCRFGVNRHGQPIFAFQTAKAANAFAFAGGGWREIPGFWRSLGKIRTSDEGMDTGFRFRDINKDGVSEIIVSNSKQNEIYELTSANQWKKSSYALPGNARLVDKNGGDNGVRFVDLNSDGHEDLVFSNEREFLVAQFVAKPVPHLGWGYGWSQIIRAGSRDKAENPVPMISRGGEFPNNGAWFKRGHMWVQNEETAHLPDKVDRRTFKELLAFDAPAAKSPEESAKAIQVSDDFQVELVAAEPLVQDPLAFDWDEKGRLWVVEMRDYHPDENGASGVVKLLEDTNGDGKYDDAKVFLDKLNSPNGIFPWRNGVLISAAPDIIFAADTNGDGKADVWKVLLTGFNKGNQQHRVNGFELGLDSWVYVANGDSDGRIKAIEGVLHKSASNKEVNIQGHDFRFKPDTAELQLVAVQTQYGRKRDDWGNWFGNNNPVWLWHVAYQQEYLARNEHLAVRSSLRRLANYPDNNQTYPISKPMQRFNWPELGNTVTSANSATPYRDELFGPEFETSIFISEPAFNLVHREVLYEKEGLLYSKRAANEQKREFLASTDQWFRPTGLKIGPDGALYIADMYRLVIEHIEYGLPGMQERVDLRAGTDKGRIYRVYPKGNTLRKIPNLARLQGPELASAMDHPNGWQRDTVQRLILHNPTSAAVDGLIPLLASASPKVRLQSMSTLASLDKLTPNQALVALQDTEPRVRANAVKLSEKLLSNSNIAKGVAKLASDTSAIVRLQAAFSLGQTKQDVATAALAQLCITDGSKPHFQTAILSSAVPHASKMLKELWKSPDKVAPEIIEHLALLATVAGSNTGVTIEPPYQKRDYAYAAGVVAAGKRTPEPINKIVEAATDKLLRVNPETKTLDPWLLKLATPSPELIIHLLQPQNHGSIHKQALTLLQKAKSIEGLLDNWATYSPTVKAGITEAATTRPEWSRTLLKAVAENRIASAQVSLNAREGFLKNRNADVANLAKKLFKTEHPKADYSKVLQLTGNASAGLTHFDSNCRICHKFEKAGGAVGPDLDSLTDRSPESLLIAILQPNLAVEETYVSYNIELKDGREFTGVITSESGSSIAFRTATAEEHTILRKDLAKLSSSGVSLMPEGFDKILTEQALADLLAYLNSGAN